jgi:mannose-6-phosphate isomerase-like protein (cupin superfamily)
MLMKSIQNGSYFQALDHTTLCELLHPARDDLELPYSIAHAVLKPGTASLPHILKESSEVYFILEGQGMMHIDSELALVEQGQAIYIPPGSEQYIRNTGPNDLKILCVVHPMWRKEDEVVLEKSVSSTVID